MKNFPAVLLAFGLALGLSMPGMAQTSLFPFVIPWDDSVPGTATDVSFLNAKPTGVNGRIIVRNGHFAEAKTGRRVRFLGVNIGDVDAFPPHDQAEKAARRMAKLGINIVRLQSLDLNWNIANGGSLWDGYQHPQHISPSQLEKLDYFVAQLEKQGIYVDMVLKMVREYDTDPRVPEVAYKQLTTGLFGKRVDEFDPTMMTLQKEYDRQILGHVNPYTHFSYAKDPAVVSVEINNENTLTGNGAGLDALPEPYRGELTGLWNAWLLKKYGTDEKLRTAWIRGVTPPGPDMLGPQENWIVEQHEGTKAALTPQPSASNTAPDAQITITQTDGTDWHLQAHITGLDLQEGATYTLTFRAKVDKERTIPMQTRLDQPDWRFIGLDDTAKLGTDWQTYRYTFMAHDVVPRHARLSWMLGAQTGTVWISDVVLKPGADGADLPPGQSLSTKTIAIPTTSTWPQHQDWLRFLAETELAYANEMRRFLRKDLGVKANLTCSQVSYGGLAGVAREIGTFDFNHGGGSDFIDNHAYWQHPTFAHAPFDPHDFHIDNTPLVSELANGGTGTLGELAAYRVAGMPYTVSEYDHPAPSEFQEEMLPVLSSFAAFQDWDVVYLFAYGGIRDNRDKIDGFFNIGSNPAAMAFFPAAAMIFRAGEIPPASTEDLLTLDINDPLFPRYADPSAVRRATWGTLPDIFAQRLALIRLDYATLNRPAPRTTLTVTGDAATAVYRAQSPSCVALAGYVGGQTISVGPLTLAFGKFGNSFAACTVTAMDGKPLAQSKRLLLTLMGKAANQDMKWDATHHGLIDWGHGPTVVEGVPATITLPADSVRHVYALDGKGRRVKEVPLAGMQSTVGPEDRTVWYEMAQ